MAISFNETFYLEQKLAQLQAAGEAGFETTADVQEAFAAAGLTAEAHYLQYGASEGLNPSADFDTNVYLDSKLAQLSTAGGFENITTREALATFLKDSGFSPLEHYNQHGAAEGVSPSAEFNAQAYLANKLADLQANDTDGTYADWTTDTLLAFFNDNGLTPLDHYTQFGRVENISPLPVEETSELTEALDTLATAEAAVDTYLEGSLENETLATYIQEKNTNTPDTYDTEVLADVRDAIGDLRDDSITDLNAAITVSGTINKSRSDSFNSAIIEEQRDILEADLAEKTGAAAEVEGLQSAVGTLTSAEASFNDAKDALAAAATAVESEYAKAGILNGNTATDISETLNYPSTSAEVAGLEYDAVTPTNNVLVESAADGALIVINEDDDVVIAEGKANYAGISALYDAVVAEFNAIVAEQNAQNSFETALAGVLAAENPEIELADAVTLTDAATTSPVTLGDGLYRDSDGTVYAFEKGGSNSGTSLEDGDSVYEVISYQVPNLDGSAATVTIGSAVTGVTAADYTAVAAATNNTVTVDTNANDLDVASYFNETTDSDGDGVSNEVGYTGTGGAIKDAPVASALAESQDTLATFEEAVSAYLEAKQLSEGLAKVDKAATDARAAIEDSEEDGGLGINLLGLGDSVTSGDDLILFAEDEGTTTTISNFGAQGEDSIYFGGDFSLVALGDSSITDRVGDVSANEIFWEEDATGLTLYVEADAAAGFDRDGVAQDQMTTIKLAGVSFDDITFEGGYLTAGEVA